MKKVLVLLPILLLSACGANRNNSNLPSSSTDAVETDKTQRYEFELNKDNLWYFIDSTYSTSGSESYKTCIYSFQGVLSYAYYDHVIVYLDYDIVGMGEQGSPYYPSTTYKAKIQFELNAAGNGILSLSYDYVPENAVPKITAQTLYGFNRSLTITSVTGVVRFAI